MHFIKSLFTWRIFTLQWVFFDYIYLREQKHLENISSYENGKSVLFLSYVCYHIMKINFEKHYSCEIFVNKAI